MFSKDIPEFRLDLDGDPEGMWSHVVAAMKPQTHSLVEEASRELSRVPGFLRWLFTFFYRNAGGLYVNEMSGLAKQLGISAHTATMLNCAYELSHVHRPRLFGCTAGVRDTVNGPIHVRTLDWPFTTMGPATGLFRFFNNSHREFISVGVPGQVGVLSGMVPGGYSVTINWAPPGRNPRFWSYGPMFLLRLVLERCSDYAKAVEILSKTPLSTSVFFTVCGVKPGEGCVIERGQYKCVVRPMTDGVVTQANHHCAACFQGNNAAVAYMEGAEYLGFSGQRQDLLAKGLRHAQPGDKLHKLLEQEPITNFQTVQRMSFCPATGEVHVERRIG